MAFSLVRMCVLIHDDSPRNHAREAGFGVTGTIKHPLEVHRAL